MNRELSDHDIHEFNWNQFVDQIDGTRIDYNQIKRIVGSFASAGRLLFDAESECSRTSTRLVALNRQLAAFTEALFGITLLCVVLLPPSALLMQLGGIFFSFSALPLKWVLFAIEFLSAATLFALSISLVTCGLVSAILRRRDAFNMGVCWTALLIVRPILYVSLLPFTAQVLANRNFERSGKAYFFVLMGVIGCILGLLSGYTLKEGLLGIAWSIGFTGLVIAAGCFTWILGDIVHLIMGPALKVLLDVFRYVGDPNYRAGLQEAFDLKLESFPRNEEIIILAHSLGSVIAADSLVNSSFWSKTRRVTLITMGSPLRRFFFRFFPRLFFPPDARGVAAVIRGRVNDFRWFNLYRPFDQIGTSLRLRGDPSGAEIRLPEWRRLLRAHTDYFGDPAVWTAINDVLARPCGLKQIRSPREVGPFRPPRVMAVSRIMSVLLRQMQRLFWLSPLLLLWMWAAAPIQKSKSNAQIAASRQQLTISGAQLLAHVEHREVDNDRVSFHSFRFVFETNSLGVTEYTLDTGGLFDEAEEFFDVDALRRAIRKNGDLQEPKSLLRPNSTIPCRSRAIFRVRWLNRNPPIFDLPEFPPRPSFFYGFVGWVFWIIWATLAGLSASYYVIKFATHLLHVFAGVEDPS
jgi:hypothetical protein